MAKQINIACLLFCSLLLSVQAAAQTDTAPKMLVTPAPDSAQSAGVEKRRFEVGVHFSVLHYDDYGDRLTEPGVGGRFTFNLNDKVALEGEVDFYPRSHEDDPTVSGRSTLALFGVKAGWRKKRFGLFGKARPGLIHFNRRLQFACITENEGDCTLPNTNFAFDLGGVVEFYMARRMLLRFDVGDTIMRSSRVGGYDTTHNLQFNAGVGFRF